MKTIKFISRVGTNADEFRKELANGSIEVFTMFICDHADGSKTFFVHEDNEKDLCDLRLAEIFKSEMRGRKPSPIPLEQRKELYDETQKARIMAKREEARKAKSSGDYSKRRMHFMFQIFDNLNSLRTDRLTSTALDAITDVCTGSVIISLLLLYNYLIYIILFYLLCSLLMKIIVLYLVIMKKLIPKMVFL